MWSSFPFINILQETCLFIIYLDIENTKKTQLLIIQVIIVINQL